MPPVPLVNAMRALYETLTVAVGSDVPEPPTRMMAKPLLAVGPEMYVVSPSLTVSRSCVYKVDPEFGVNPEFWTSATGRSSLVQAEQAGVLMTTPGDSVDALPEPSFAWTVMVYVVDGWVERSVNDSPVLPVASTAPMVEPFRATGVARHGDVVGRFQPADDNGLVSL